MGTGHLLIIKEISSRCQISLSEDELTILLDEPLSEAEVTRLATSPLELLDHKKGTSSIIGESTSLGDTIHLRVPRNPKKYFVGNNLNDLLNKGGWKCIPKEFIFLENSPHNRTLYHSSETPDSTLKAYIEAVNLAKLLRDKADHVNTTKSRASIFDLHKLDINLDFTHKDIHEHWRFPTQETSKFLDSQNFSELRMEVFTTTLWSLLKDIPPAERFSELLSKGDIFLRNLNYNFKLYKKDITIDKRIEKAREDELSLSQSINKILVSVETKALAIPAILLVACKTSTSVEEGSINNILLALGAVFVCMNLGFGFHSQKQMALTLNDEIDDALERVSLKSSELDKYKERFNRLKNRLTLANQVKAASFYLSVALALFFVVYAII